MTHPSKIVVLYDIHGNFPALESVMNEIQDDVDHLVIGGDVILGPMSNECLDLLKESTVPLNCIKGNCETAVLNYLDDQPLPALQPQVMEEIKWTAHHISTDHLRWTRSWPENFIYTHPTAGKISFYHSAPGDENAIFTEETKEDILDMLFQNDHSNIIICGHTHIPFDKKLKNKRIVNAGSVGMSFNGPGAQYLTINSGINFICTNYNTHRASEFFRQTTYPNVSNFINNFILNQPKKEAMLTIYKSAEWKPKK